MIPLTIITTTYVTDARRHEAVMRAVSSWAEHLQYDGNIFLHDADDGSTFGNYGKPLGSPLAEVWSAPLDQTRQERKGVGASLNAGIAKSGDLMMYIVDDWALTAELDVTPWANLLLKDDSVGAVRLGPPHPWLTGTVKLFHDGWGLVLDKHHYVYSMRPYLFHRRFVEAYGPFKEGQSALETERLYNLNVCATKGPSTVYALPYPWKHLGAEDGTELSAINPRSGA